LKPAADYYTIEVMYKLRRSINPPIKHVKQVGQMNSDN
jgi:hypothetical protein